MDIDIDIDWERLRKAATEAASTAYAPYSNFPVGAAGLVDDGRIVIGCNVENAGYGVTLCAECGVVSALHASGGGRLVALACVDGAGAALMPCGRCRQLLWEAGGPRCLVDAVPEPISMAGLLPHAFGPEDLTRVRPDTGTTPPAVPASLRRYQGRGTVFVHADSAGGQRVWTGYWERSTGAGDEPAGILEEAPVWPAAAEAVAWGRARTDRVVVVDADGASYWAGAGDPPSELPPWPATLAEPASGGVRQPATLAEPASGGVRQPATLAEPASGGVRQPATLAEPASGGVRQPAANGRGAASEGSAG